MSFEMGRLMQWNQARIESLDKRSESKKIMAAQLFVADFELRHDRHRIQGRLDLASSLFPRLPDAMIG
jgi:hypothetical protein